MKQVDYKLFFSVIALIIFWMIMISSVSIWSSHRVTSIMAENGLIPAAYNHFYVIRNIIHVSISLTILGFLVKVPYKFFEKYAKHFFIASLILLVIVLIIGKSLKGATWWIAIPWIPFTIQPTEFLKFSLIIFLASFFKQNYRDLHSLERGFLPFASILWIILLLVGAQPDFWTILVIVPLAFIMFFTAGANIKYLGIMFFLWVFVAVSVYLAGDYDPATWKNTNDLGYITQRIDNFLADNEEAINNKTINYQTEQALIAIGSGGFTGLWFWNSVQKFWYLPEVQGDFIFSVIVEELGFIGAVFLLGLYIYIWFRWYLISKLSKDPFAKYSALGVTSWILLQAFINIGVNLNIIPLTGITLPFISYGGSSLLALILGLALLLSISREIDTSLLSHSASLKHRAKKRLHFLQFKK